jgi:hypothetical protein
VVSAHLYRELHLGNVNLALLFVALTALCWLRQGRSLPGGILLGAIVLFKPHFLVLMPLLGICGLFIPLGYALATMGLGLFLPALAFGMQANLELLRQWAETMSGHNSAGMLAQSPNTIPHWVAELFPSGGASIQLAAAALCLGSMYGLILLSLRREARGGRIRASFPLAFCGLIAVIPNITVTDTEHFLFCLPLIGYLLSSYPGQRPAFRTLTIAACVAYGCNWHDLWGSRISQALDRSGLLGAGNFMIILLAAAASWRPAPSLGSSEVAR